MWTGVGWEKRNKMSANAHQLHIFIIQECDNTNHNHHTLLLKTIPYYKLYTVIISTYYMRTDMSMYCCHIVYLSLSSTGVIQKECRHSMFVYISLPLSLSCYPVYVPFGIVKLEATWCSISGQCNIVQQLFVYPYIESYLRCDTHTQQPIYELSEHHHHRHKRDRERASERKKSI